MRIDGGGNEKGKVHAKKGNKSEKIVILFLKDWLGAYSPSQPLGPECREPWFKRYLTEYYCHNNLSF